MAKPTKCSICNLDCIDDVNFMLTSGDPEHKRANIIKFVKEEYDIKITAGSLSRHYNNHVLEKQSNKQLQKKGIIEAKARGKSKIKDKVLNNLDKDSKDDTSILDLQDPNNPIMQVFTKLSQDFDPINEMLLISAIAKERMFRALKEEQDNELVINSTGYAIKDYMNSVKEMNDIMSGSDSLTKLRFNQLTTMLSKMFNNSDVSDRSRYEILGLLGTSEKKKIIPIRPISN